MLRTVLLLLALTLPALADDLSGPLRKTLTDESWGTIYYVPTVLKDYDYSRDVAAGVRTISSALGAVTIEETGIGSFTLTYPDGAKLVLDSKADGITVGFRGQTYQFSKDASGNLTVKVPEDEISYVLTAQELVITGKKGTTRIVERDGNYTMESPVGLFSYVPDPDGGFKVRGAPAVKHTYLMRGAIFENAGVGVFVDFKRLSPQSPMFRFMDWIPTLEYH